MFRYKVLVVDAVVAIVLVESSMSESSILSGLSALHTSFPDDSKSEYQNRAQTILKLLKLEDLLKESENYSDGLNLQKLLADISLASSVQSTSVDSSKCYASSHSSEDLPINYQVVEQQNCFTAQNKTPPPDVTDAVSPENPVNILELIASFNEEAPIRCDREVLRHGLTNVGLEDEKNKMVIDEVSTLDDLNKIFHENFISPDAASESFGKLFKKKKTSTQSASNMLEPNQHAQNADFQRTPQNLKAQEDVAAPCERSFPFSKRSPPKKKMFLQESSVLETVHFNEVRGQNDTSHNNKLKLNASDINRPSTSSFKQRLQEKPAQNKFGEFRIDETCRQNCKSYEHQISESSKSEYFERVDNVLPTFFKRKHSMTTTNATALHHQQKASITEIQRKTGMEFEIRDFDNESETAENRNLKCQRNSSKKDSIDNASATSASLASERTTPLNCSTPLPKDNNCSSEKHNPVVNDHLRSRIRSKLSKFARPVISKDSKSKDSDEICQPVPSKTAVAAPKDAINLQKVVTYNRLQQTSDISSVTLPQKQCNRNVEQTFFQNKTNSGSKEPQLFDCSNRPIQTSQFSQATFKRVFSNAVYLPDYTTDDLDIENLFDM